MKDSRPERDQPGMPDLKTQGMHCALLVGVCALVIGVYAWCAESGWLELWNFTARNTYYNTLASGLRTGELSLQREVPSGLAKLTDPYDPKVNDPYISDRYPLVDLSYYNGNLFLYFGPAPALVLFWPSASLVGHYLLHKHAVLIFFSAGFLAGVSIFWSLWRRYFVGVPAGLVAAGALALGLANFAPMILQRCDVYEVAISCGYALTMAALWLLWQALHATRRGVWWLAGASVAYGLAVAARPSLLFGAVALLVPLTQAWRERAEAGRPSPIGALLLAAAGPIFLISLGLMLYNWLRFDNPLEFGLRYILSSDRHDTMRHFGLDNLWFNVRVYFLEPAQWSGRFPFVHDIAVPALPAGHAAVQNPFGFLTNTPLVWLALAAPLIWRSQVGTAASALRWFTVVLVLLFGACALTLGLYAYACLRFQVEILSVLVLMAAMGVSGLERALSGRMAWRSAARWGWALLLVFSVAFNLAAGFERLAGTLILRGGFFSRNQRPDEALACFRRALALQPDNVEARTALGTALCRQGNAAEAIVHFSEALRRKPDLAEAQNNLGVALLQQGQVEEAMARYQQALRLKPDYAQAYHNLGTALYQQGRVSEAVGCLEQAVRLNPDYGDAHYNLAVALFQLGKVREAVGQLEQILQAHPEDGMALNRLAWVLATCADAAIRNGGRAVELAEGANKVSGGKDPTILDTLAAAYAEAARFDDAVRVAQAAINLLSASGQAGQAGRIGERMKLYQASQPYHERATDAR